MAKRPPSRKVERRGTRVRPALKVIGKKGPYFARGVDPMTGVTLHRNERKRRGTMRDRRKE